MQHSTNPIFNLKSHIVPAIICLVLVCAFQTELVAQRGNNWYLGYRKNDFHIATVNDVYVGGDKFRTAALEFGIGDASLGFNLYTADPPEDEHWKGIGTEPNPPRTIFKLRKKHGMYSSGKRIYAGLYFGYKNGNYVSRIGVDAAFVQDFIQNGIHILVGSPYFNPQLGPPPSIFHQQFIHSDYSLY